MPQSKCGALPLGYKAMYSYTIFYMNLKVVEGDGFEPMIRELQSHALPLGYGALFIMERVKRIELSQSAWKAEVLPLNYTRN